MLSRAWATDQYFKKIRAKKKALVEGKSWAHTDVIYNICVQTFMIQISTCQRNVLQLMFKKENFNVSPFKLKHTLLQ